jgi:hypothetical protein
MAEHKVPQDVEAEDKLLGPLSFRQFVYAMIALSGAAMAYFILSANIVMPIKIAAVIPILVFVCFGTLAIPRKGQPMETYIGALIHFYFQPTKRLWDPDGQDSLVEITNPPIDTIPQVKEIGGVEAAQRLSFLADLEDSQGWSIRGNVNLNDDYALAANMATDVFDDTSLNEEFSAKLAQAEQQVRNEAVARMNTIANTPASQSGFAPPSYGTTPAIVTPPPVAAPAPVAPVTEYDEASLSAMLKQSAANNSMSAFQQTVIQPPSSSPVLNNPTLTTTAVPTTAPIPTSVSTLTLPPTSISTPSPEQESELTNAPIPTPPPEPESSLSKSDIIGPRENIVEEEVISHNGGTSNNQSGEISLH